MKINHLACTTRRIVSMTFMLTALVVLNACSTVNPNFSTPGLAFAEGNTRVKYLVRGPIGAREVVLVPESTGRISGVIRQTGRSRILGAFNAVPFSRSQIGRGSKGVTVWRETPESALSGNSISVEVTRFAPAP